MKVEGGSSEELPTAADRNFEGGAAVPNETVASEVVVGEDGFGPSDYHKKRSTAQRLWAWSERWLS